jgi:hypothetical protein
MSSIIFFQLIERNILVASAVLAIVFLAYKVSSLMVLVVIAEPCRNTDCVRTLELLSVWYTLLEMLRRIIS